LANELFMRPSVEKKSVAVWQKPTAESLSLLNNFLGHTNLMLLAQRWAAKYRNELNRIQFQRNTRHKAKISIKPNGCKRIIKVKEMENNGANYWWPNQWVSTLIFLAKDSCQKCG